MAEFTLLKLQVDDASFTAHAPFSSSDDEDDVTDVESGSGSGPRGLFALVAGLVFLMVVAIVVKKLRGGSDTDVETREE